MVVEISALGLKTELAQNVETVLRVGPADLEAVMKHYDVTTEILIGMIVTIKEWYAKQAHLPAGQLHDRQILGHLIFRGFSVERAKGCIDNFYTARRRMPELVCGMNPPAKADWIRFMEQGYWFVLPKKTAENYRVTIFRLNAEEKEAIVIQVMRMAFLLCEYRIWNDISLGDCWIIDLRHVTMAQAMQFTPDLVSKILYYLSSCFGTKLRSVYLVNMPSFAATILNLFKNAIPAKVVERLHVSTTEDIESIFSKDILPEEYGGSEASCQTIAGEWLKTFQTKPWQKYLVEQDSIQTNESKRLTPSKADEIFGMDGSFRKLILD